MDTDEEGNGKVNEGREDISFFSVETSSRKAIQISAKTWPKKGLASRVFGFVEGGYYSYEAEIRNIGEGTVEAEGAGGDIHALDFVWNFSNGQAITDRLEFPSELGVGETYTYPPESHEIMSPGSALLYIRAWRAGNAIEVIFKDSAGNLALPDESRSGPYARDFDTRWSVTNFNHSFASFRGKSRGEIYQAILITVAIIALVVNAVFSAFNALG